MNSFQKFVGILSIILFVIAGIACAVWYQTRLLQNIQGVTISPFLTTSETGFVLKGTPLKFTGVNVYSAATSYGHNVGCGGQVQHLESLFQTLKPSSIVRVWGWQGSMAINPKTKQLDWTGLDRVINAATSSGQMVIISLGTQSGVCDDGQWKDLDWYSKGFKRIYNPSVTPYSYLEYVRRIVSRYKNSTAVAMWELINEPETSACAPGFSGASCYGHQLCPDHTTAAKVLRSFFDTVGSEIKKIDPNHLIESGLMGNGQCGSDNQYYQMLHESPYIDVASYHDYDAPDSPMPGDQWNGLEVRLRQMKKIGKPLIIGEAGILAQDDKKQCISFLQRREKIQAKINKQFSAGVAGYLVWNWVDGNAGVCNYDIPPQDPLMHIFN